MHRVYLDNNATTPLDPEVLGAMQPYWTEEYGNASSIHGFGQRARAAVESARESVARLIGAHADEIIFTSGGTESDNAAVFGAAEAAKPRTASGGKHVVTTAIEHPAVLAVVKALGERGFSVSVVPAGTVGVVDPGEVERAIRPETVLVSVMHANNELGTIQPVAQIGGLARERDITFHTDAVQSVGKIPVNVDALGVDLLSLSAHKLYGPKGVGALYVRKGTRLGPLLHGGHHERDRRPGTENVPGIVGLGRAAELALDRLDEEARRVVELRDRLEREILHGVPGVAVNGDARCRVPSTSNLRFAEVDGEGLVIALDLKGVACSTGAACSSGSLEPSHVLAAMGLARGEARSSVRFSLGRFSTDEDVDAVLNVLPAVVARLRSVAPQKSFQLSAGRPGI